MKKIEVLFPDSLVALLDQFDRFDDSPKSSTLLESAFFLWSVKFLAELPLTDAEFSRVLNLSRDGIYEYLTDFIRPGRPKLKFHEVNNEQDCF